MSPVNPIPAVLCLAIALLTCQVASRRFAAPPIQGRYASVDGLRGFLAFFVFLHHSCVWYFFSKNGQWALPSSNLYTHFGQSSVIMFFMITGFLFFGKILEGRKKEIDWGRLYISRFLRLVPLFFFSMLLLFLIVAILSNGRLNEPISDVLIESYRCLFFSIKDVNKIHNTAIIVAGVTWTLKHEWLFYFSLPFIALLARVIAPVQYLIIGLLACGIWAPHGYILLSFLGGFAASILVRNDVFCEFSKRRTSTFLLGACIVLAIYLFPAPHAKTSVLCFAIAFSLIACGNDVFGLLTSKAARILGEISYSVYMLHGIMLFITFNFIIGPSNYRIISVANHWLIIMILTPVLVSTCLATFILIESPAIRSTAAITNWLRTAGITRKLKAEPV